MTNRYQQNAALWIHEDRQERHAELEWREQLRRDKAARDLRAENARRMAAALNRH